MKIVTVCIKLSSIPGFPWRLRIFHSALHERRPGATSSDSVYLSPFFYAIGFAWLTAATDLPVWLVVSFSPDTFAREMSSQRHIIGICRPYRAYPAIVPLVLRDIKKRRGLYPLAEASFSIAVSHVLNKASARNVKSEVSKAEEDADGRYHAGAAVWGDYRGLCRHSCFRFGWAGIGTSPEETYGCIWASICSSPPSMLSAFAAGAAS